jgi:hypothetical protein
MRCASAALDDLLHEADPVRLRRVVLVAGQQPAHRVAPPGLAGEPDRRAAEGVDTALDFELREAGPGRRDADVGGQQQFDAQRHAPALRDGDQGRGPCAIQPPGIAPVVRDRQIAGRDGRADVHQIETGGEMITVREQHARPHGGVGFQQPVRAGQVGEHRPVERVAFVRPVQADQQDVSVALQRHGVEVR